MIRHEMGSRFSLCPRPCGVDAAVSFESVSPDKSQNPVDALMALNAPVLLWLMRGLDGFLERDCDRIRPARTTCNRI